MQKRLLVNFNTLASVIPVVLQALAVQLYSKASDFVSSQMSTDLHFAKGLRVKLVKALVGKTF
jgi:hypothetical protein